MTIWIETWLLIFYCTRRATLKISNTRKLFLPFLTTTLCVRTFCCGFSLREIVNSKIDTRAGLNVNRLSSCFAYLEWLTTLFIKIQNAKIGSLSLILVAFLTQRNIYKNGVKQFHWTRCEKWMRNSWIPLPLRFESRESAHHENKKTFAHDSRSFFPLCDLILILMMFYASTTNSQMISAMNAHPNAVENLFMNREGRFVEMTKRKT